MNYFTKLQEMRQLLHMNYGDVTVIQNVVVDLINLLIEKELEKIKPNK